MRLIHQKDNIVASVDDLAIIEISKLEDGCDQDLSLAYLSLKFLLWGDVFDIGNLGAGEIASNLVFQVDTVINNDHGRGFELVLEAEFLRRKNHQPWFTGSLEMPDQSLSRTFTRTICGKHTLNNGFTTQILLITGNHFHFPSASSSWKDRIKAVNVEQNGWPDEFTVVMGNSLEVSLFALLVSIPGPPLFYRSTNTGILYLTSLTREGKDIRDKHLRNTLLVMDNVHRSITPGDLWAHRRFRFADHHRYSVDDVHQIQTLSPFFACSREFPLIGDNTLILWSFIAEESNVKIIAILPERIGVFFKKQFPEPIVGRYQFIRITADWNSGTKLIDNLFGLVYSNGVQL